MIEVPFIIYADIESLLLSETTNQLDEYKIPKGTIQKHIANSIGYFFHARFDENLSHYDGFSGPDCVDQFIERLLFLAENVVWPKIHEIEAMSLSEEEENDFQDADVCHICKKEFYFKSNMWNKVRDHCHLSGRYRGASHSECNLKFQISKSVPVVFHNLDYDSHFLIERLANAFPSKMSLIPKNSEHYISFSKELPDYNDNNINNVFEKENGHSNFNDVTIAFDGRKKKEKRYRERMKLRFIDSYRFLNCSLAQLAKNLPSEKLSITRKQWANLTEQKMGLLTMKGVYPYTYMDSWDKFNETKLPSPEQFYDDLNECGISDEQYNHAQNIWNSFNIHTLREYTDIYLKTDVLLLADVFENFRNNCIKLYGLDPAHYYTLPGYSWDCMLKYTKIEIELLKDVDQLMFVERGIRGGISQASNRYCEANNKYIGADYDPEKPTNYLLYLDVNNLYGWAMSQALPLSQFKWNMDTYSSVDDIQTKVMQMADDAPVGFILEVDLEYPQYLHDLHNDYPFCCEHMEVGDSSEKRLVLTLYDKKNYIIHYRMLKMALKHGLKLKKVHRILEFKQSPWLNDYIMLNTNERAKSTSKFEKDLYKLINNAVYGKTMENIRKRVDIKLVNKWDGRFGMQTFIARPNFKRSVVFNENFAACELQRLNIYMNKPVAVGAAILDISKYKMYEFHYDFILQYFNCNQCKLQYSDTDSFLYSFQCENIYDFIREHKDRFDTSGFAENNPYGIQPFNKKVLGVMKDEYDGEIIKESVCVRSKLYTIKLNGNKIVKKGKGVKKNVLNKKISFDDYKRCIDELCVVEKEQIIIKSYHHRVYTVKNEKKVLDPNDKKRFIIPNKYNTLALGHYGINSYKNQNE
ncbi:uncharacterized protein LOC129572785 [Sitodiplosis mosellana]|uniref:uncharacterized protein LOC129571258 n=1 Tax=Sitodiplosis mosellana TaxID=263140 RepID=UPI002444D0E0|nr:uncharacterized protein LOC129571258 [Sitodiplosis mosellana]XP_055308861.1 uncharacterized protein LOC129572785 [Sitodiplosis mosellana]